MWDRLGRRTDDPGAAQLGACKECGRLIRVHPTSRHFWVKNEILCKACHEALDCDCGIELMIAT